MEDGNGDASAKQEFYITGRLAASVGGVAHGQAALIQMAEFTGDLIGMCDSDGTLAYLNPAGRRLIGIDEADIFPTRLTDYVAPAQRHMVEEIVVPTARRDGVWEGEMQLVNLKTDVLIDVQRSTYATYGDQGEVTGFVSVMRDVTIQKREQNRLLRQVEMFFSLIESNPFGVYLVDADFTLRVISNGAQKVFENVRPLIGRDFAEVLHAIWPEPFANEAIALFRHTLATGEPYEAPSTVEQRADVEAVEAYHWRIERITLPDDRHGVVCHFYDLTERENFMRALAQREAQLDLLARDLQRQVRDRTVSLKRANERLSAEIERRDAVHEAQLHSQKIEAIGQLTSGIAHDFNNILGAVMGALTVIDRRVDDPRIREIAMMAQSAAERGAALVRQLMAFARRDDAAPHAIAPAELLDEAAILIEHALPRGVMLSVQCSADVWNVFADPGQLQSVLLNLICNARDAMGGVGRIGISVGNNPVDAEDHPVELVGRDAVCIAVDDDGPGMAPDILQRITEPFFTTKPAGQGTGLGLAMVKRFVDHSGGVMRIESVEGDGTCFRLYLPRADNIGSAGITQNALAAAQPDASRAFETILLVDDDKELLGALSASLAAEGYEVISAPDARVAIGHVLTRSIDLVVTDVDMLDITGFELCAQLRELAPDLPCLLMTGGSGNGVPAGETILRKPFSPILLSDAIRRTITKRDIVDTDAERLDRLALRLKSDCARSLLAHWRELRHDAPVPPFERFSLSECREPQRIVAASVDMTRVPVEFTFKLVGDALRDALPSGVMVTDLSVTGNDSLMALEAAYRRCALTGQPSYEHARFNLGEEHIETLERLLLPFSTDGRTIDHVVGAIIIDHETGNPP